MSSVYKFGMVCTLVYRCFCICLDWTEFHTELTFLKQDKYFKKFPDNIHLVKEKVPTLERKRQSSGTQE